MLEPTEGRFRVETAIPGVADAGDVVVVDPSEKTATAERWGWLSLVTRSFLMVLASGIHRRLPGYISEEHEDEQDGQELVEPADPPP